MPDGGSPTVVISSTTTTVVRVSFHILKGRGTGCSIPLLVRTPCLWHAFLPREEPAPLRTARRNTLDGISTLPLSAAARCTF